MNSSRLPALGPRGEGWFASQVVFVVAIVIACATFGGQWSGTALVVTRFVGGAFIVGAVLLGLVAIRDLGGSLSPLPRPRDGAELVERGIYSRLRHPIYAAVVLLAIGSGLLTASWLALGLAVGLAVLLDLKARREEVWLRERFPDYTDYAHRTKRFVPGVY